jgi:hypothetical protein
MKLQLYIIKHYGLKYRAKGPQIRFAVIDKDKATKYPANFLCLLPKLINPKLKQKHKFVELFGSESPQLAFNLLNWALDTEKDIELREAIRKRLKKISIKSPHQVNCRLCGNYFEVINRKLEPHRVCRDCRQRIYA